MKTDRPEPNVLRIRVRPWFVPGLGLVFVVAGVAHALQAMGGGGWDTDAIFGTAISILLGGGMALYTARYSDYVFDRGERLFHWRWRRPWKTRMGHLSFRNIERAAVQRSSQPKSSTTRVVLYTTDGVFPLIIGYSAHEAQHRKAVEAINEILGSVRY